MEIETLDYFHSYVKGRRKKLHILEILIAKRDIVSFNESIRAKDISLF